MKKEALFNERDLINPDPEFSRKLLVQTLGKRPKELELLASETECLKLAQRFKVLSVSNFKVALTISREPKKSPYDPEFIMVEGTFSADISQKCVVTLEPIASTINETILVKYYDGDDEEHPYKPIDNIENIESIEPFFDGSIDLGEVVAQYLAISIDPYPKLEHVDVLRYGEN